MFKLIRLFLISVAHAYNHMNGLIIEKPYYVNGLNDFHSTCVDDAIEKYNSYSIGEIKYGSPEESNEIKYYDGKTGVTELDGYYKDNEWIITRMDIMLSPEIDNYNVCVNTVLHELGHGRGLYHSKEETSIMNMTVKIFTDGTYKNAELISLTWNDWIGLWTYKYGKLISF